jgi:hypothetical protein
MFAINADENEARQFADNSPLAALLSRPVALADRQPAWQPQQLAEPVARPARQPRTGRIASPRRQKLATRQLAVGRYAFTYLGVACEVARDATGWRLTIGGTAGNRRYETKRHAVNAARVFLDKQASQAPAATAAPAIRQPQAVVAPAPLAQQPAAPARRVNWRDPAAPWRQEPVSRRQARLIGHLLDKARACGLNLAAVNASPVNKGAASELIDALKAAIGNAANVARQTGVALDGCDIGPFAGGYCTVCGLIEKS